MRVIVFGSGGMAKDVIGCLEHDKHEIAYVVSTEPFNSPMFDKYEVRQEIEEIECCVMAVADPALKRQLVEQHKYANWTTYAHWSAFISPHAKVGRGCVFLPGATVLGDAVVGEFCTLNAHAGIHHDSVLGAYSTLSPSTTICGHCDVGEDCFIGVGACLAPGVSLSSETKVSAGAVVRRSVGAPCTIYGDQRGEYRVLPLR